jgi:hypothetical protein
LLNGPPGRWMFSDIEMQDPPRFDLHCDEDVHDLERCRSRNEEIASNDGLGMIPNESRPALVVAPAARPVGFEILFAAKPECLV